MYLLCTSFKHYSHQLTVGVSYLYPKIANYNTVYIYTIGHKLGTTSFSLSLKYFFSNVWKHLQLRTTKHFMDEHNITQTTKKEQAFFSKISNRKCYCSWKWVIKIEQKIKWTKFQFGLLLIKICITKTHDPLNNEYNRLV